MHCWNSKWAMLPHKLLLSETKSDKNMNLNYWLMWVSCLLLAVCFLPVALRKVFALNTVTLHNNIVLYHFVLYLSFSFGPSVPSTLKSVSSFVSDLQSPRSPIQAQIKNWLSIPCTISSTHFPCRKQINPRAAQATHSHSLSVILPVLPPTQASGKEHLWFTAVALAALVQSATVALYRGCIINGRRSHDITLWGRICHCDDFIVAMAFWSHKRAVGVWQVRSVCKG